MGRRKDLHQKFKTILGTDNVYFSPPEDVKICYPAIVYSRDQENTIHADNSPYSQTKRYQVTVIDQDSDSEIPNKIGSLPLSKFQRFYAADDLNHDIYILYF